MRSELTTTIPKILSMRDGETLIREVDFASFLPLAHRTRCAVVADLPHAQEESEILADALEEKGLPFLAADVRCRDGYFSASRRARLREICLAGVADHLSSGPYELVSRGTDPRFWDDPRWRPFVDPDDGRFPAFVPPFDPSESGSSVRVQLWNREHALRRRQMLMNDAIALDLARKDAVKLLDNVRSYLLTDAILSAIVSRKAGGPELDAVGPQRTCLAPQTRKRLLAFGLRHEDQLIMLVKTADPSFKGSVDRTRSSFVKGDSSFYYSNSFDGRILSDRGNVSYRLRGIGVKGFASMRKEACRLVLEREKEKRP